MTPSSTALSMRIAHDPFIVNDHDAIVTILLGLARRNVMLSGTFNAGADFLLTAVLDVDPEEAVVYLDVNANEDRNQRLLVSKQTVFSATDGGARVQWTSSAVARGEFGGRMAFRIRIPEKLQYVQQRASYRVNTPITNPVLCHLPLAPDHEVVLPLADISVNGISVILPSDPEPAIRQCAEFRNCRIEHPDLGVVTTTLVVRNIWLVNHKNDTQRQHAGFEFAAIQARTQSIIQRFVYKLERRLIATSNEKAVESAHFSRRTAGFAGVKQHPQRNS